MSRRWIVALAFVGIAAPAGAQFTTFIAPPSPVKDSIKAAVVAQQHAAADSITRTQITDMKTWVDSAAGLVVPVQHSDSTLAKNTLIRDTATVARSTVPTGGLAPATASSLPLILLFGGAAMLLGFALLRLPSPLQRRIDR